MLSKSKKLDDFKESVFEKIIKDYGKIILKQIQLPQNSYVVQDILEDCLKKQAGVDAATQKLIRSIIKNFI